MPGIDVITSFLLVVAIATLLVAVVVWQTHRTQRTIIVWLASGVLGVLLGCIGWYAAARTMNYQWVRVVSGPEGIAPAAPTSTGMPGMGGGMGMPSMGGGMGKGGGMGGMGMGPRPKRDLTTLVRKLELLTGDIALTLTAEQAAAVGDCLKDVEKPATMSDDEAKAKHEKLLALFTEPQKARFEAIGLPRPAGRGGAPGGPGGPGGTPGMGGPGGMPGMMGAGAPKQDENQNPFQQEAEAKALKSLRDRLAPKGPADKAAPKPAEKAPPKPAEKAPAKK